MLTHYLGKELAKYNIRVNSDNTAFNISLKINDYGEFTINALYQGSVLDLNPSFKIIVQYGQCSMHEPKTELMLIDRRNEYYIGETISVHFQCKDILGNIVQTEGTEIFSANIRQITLFTSFFEWNVFSTVYNSKNAKDSISDCYIKHTHKNILKL